MKLDLETCQSQEFWLRLCPQLSISTQALKLKNSQTTLSKLNTEQWSVCKTTIAEDGYFVFDEWFDADKIDELSLCFEQLSQNGIHPVFAFVFDQFWELLLAMQPMYSDLLGDYDCLPAVWSWYVRPETQTAFPPHRDQVREVFIEDEDHLDYVTIWIPLTDLNHLSSSMCVLPASLDPDYEDCTPQIRVENMQDVRSLQGKRGSVFCWTTQLAHWGTKQSQHGLPRMSVGFYLKRSAAESMDDGPPINFEMPLPLAERLAIIGQQIIDYSRTADEVELEFAAQLTKR
jgi:hypothetical protein